MSNGRLTLCACCQRDFVVVLSSRAKTPAVCELGPDTLNAPRSHRAAATASKHKVLHCHHTAAAGAAIPPPLPPRTGKHKPVQLHSHLRTHRLPEASAERFECLSSLKSQTFHDFNDFRASEVLFYHHFFMQFTVEMSLMDIVSNKTLFSHQKKKPLLVSLHLYPGWFLM